MIPADAQMHRTITDVEAGYGLSCFCLAVAAEASSTTAVDAAAAVDAMILADADAAPVCSAATTPAAG